MQAYHDIDLVPISDKDYRTFCRRHAERARARGPLKTDPFDADYGRNLSKWEELFRAVVSRFHASSDNRVLAYRQGHSNGIREYREIDFVAVSAGVPQFLIELKFREQYDVLTRRGIPQLKRSLDIARSRWPNLGGLCVHVFLGCVLQLVEEEPVFHSSFSSLADLPSSLIAAESPQLIWLSGKELAAMGIAQGLITEVDIETLCQSRDDSIDPLSTVAGPPHPVFGSMSDVFGGGLSSSEKAEPLPDERRPV